MAWKKVIVSGSSADLLNVSASAGFKGNLVGNVTGTATQVGNSLTVDNSTIQLDSGTTYDGAAAKTVSLKDGGTTLAKQADMAADRIQGRANGAGTGVPQALTATQVRTIINVEDGADVTDAAGIAALGAGIVSSSAQVSSLAGTNDSTITITAGNGLSGGGSFTTNTGSNGSISLAVGVDDSTIELSGDAVRVKDGGITLAKQANMAADRIQGRANGAGTGAPQALTAAQVRTIINVEDGADETDTANVTSAGALMDSELAEIGTVKALTKAGISGSFVQASASFSTRVTANDAKLTANTSNVTTAGALMDSELADLAAVKAINQGLTTESNVTFNNVIATGNLDVQGTTTTLNTTNLNVEDQFILINSGSNSKDAGIIFGGTSGTNQQGKALIWDYSFNSNDGRLAVSTADVAWNNTTNFAGGTDGYYVAGVFIGSETDAADAKADHRGNIRVTSGEIFIYV